MQLHQPRVWMVDISPIIDRYNDGRFWKFFTIIPLSKIIENSIGTWIYYHTQDTGDSPGFSEFMDLLDQEYPDVTFNPDEMLYVESLFNQIVKDLYEYIARIIGRDVPYTFEGFQAKTMSGDVLNNPYAPVNTNVVILRETYHSLY